MHTTFFELIPGIGPDHAHIIGFALVLGLMLFAGVRIRARYAALGDQAVIPDRTWTLRNVVESLYEALYNVFEGVLGHHDAARYAPMLLTIFTVIFLLNVLGEVPGFPAPTKALGLNTGMALFVFFWYQIEGFKANGIGYLKHFLGPVWWLAPLMLVIELVSHFVRPVTLAIRLTGNMNGDHLALEIFHSLVAVGLPVVFLALGLFVCLVQAFVFTLLSALYLKLAVEHDH